MSTGNLRNLSAAELESKIASELKKLESISPSQIPDLSKKFSAYYRRFKIVPESESTLAASLKVLWQRESREMLGGSHDSSVTGT